MTPTVCTLALAAALLSSGEWHALRLCEGRAAPPTPFASCSGRATPEDSRACVPATPQPAVTALIVTPDGKGFLHGSQAGVVYRPFTSGAEEGLATQLEHVHAFAFSPDGKTLAVAGGTPAESGTVELWSWPARKVLGRFEGHEDLAHDVVWLASGKVIATASADRTIRFWDVADRQCTTTLTGHSGPVLALAVSPDGTLLCSGSADQTIRVWDAATGKLLRALNNHLGPVHSLSFRAPRDDVPPTLASASTDATVRLWHPATGRLLRIIRHPAPVYAVAWGHDGTCLYSGAKDGQLGRLDPDAADPRALALANGWIVSLAVCPCTGRLVAGDSHGRVFFPPAKP